MNIITFRIGSVILRNMLYNIILDFDRYYIYLKAGFIQILFDRWNWNLNEKLVTSQEKYLKIMKMKREEAKVTNINLLLFKPKNLKINNSISY